MATMDDLTSAVVYGVSIAVGLVLFIAGFCAALGWLIGSFFHGTK